MMVAENIHRPMPAIQIKFLRAPLFISSFLNTKLQHRDNSYVLE